MRTHKKMDLKRRSNYSFAVVLILMLFVHDGNSCFPNNSPQSIVIANGEPFYQECQCENEALVNNLKWLDAQGHEIKQRKDQEENSNMFTEQLGGTISINIPIMTKAISGVYKCVTTNNGRVFEQAYNVSTYDRPHFVNSNPTQYLIKGTNSTITCQAISNLKLLKTWNLGQDETQVNNDNKYEITENGLLVKNVDNNDANKYKCTATLLEHGDNISTYIAVEVITLPVIEELKVTPNHTVREGEKLSIQCLASGIPHPEYIWNKTSDTRPIGERNVTWIQEMNTIKFERVNANDRGMYECHVINKAGEARRQIYINVLVPPVITEFSNITEVEGNVVNIRCKASGWPQPMLKIEQKVLNGASSITSLPGSQMTNGNESELHFAFANVSANESGVYTCYADNAADSAFQEAHVNILHKPYFETMSDIVWGWDGEQVNISCDNRSNPPAKIYWSYKGNNIKTPEEFEKINLMIDKANSESTSYIAMNITKMSPFGEYQCDVSNTIGNATKYITLREAFPPPRIENVWLSDATAKSLTFSIEHPYNADGPNTTGITAQYNEKDIFILTNIHKNRTWALNRPFKLDKLRPGVTYYIKFAGQNDVGTGQWTDIFNFTTPEKSIPENPVWDFSNKQNNKLKWHEVESNGDPLDYYLLLYCPQINNTIDQDLCDEKTLPPSTNEIDFLNDFLLPYNVSYHIQLFAHNSAGNSKASDYFLTLQKEDQPVQTSMLSAGAIIGISIVIVILCLLLLDIMLFFCKRKGIIATCFDKNKRTNEDNLNSQKVLLRDNVDATTGDTLKKTDKRHKEFEYNKDTGIITGKHSAV